MPATPSAPEASHLTWSTHLARRQLGKAVDTGALILVASLAAAYAFASALLGLLAGLLLTAAVSDFLFPLRFLLSDEGIEARGPFHRRRMSWSQVKGVRRDEYGVKLSPLVRPSRLEAYRGIYLWFEGNAEQVMAFIADHTKADPGAGHLPSA